MLVVVGLLERWDRRNQRTADYQRATAEPLGTFGEATATQPSGDEIRAWLVFEIAGWIAVSLVIRLVGFGPLAVVMVVVLLAGISAYIVRARRRRRAWEAANPPPGPGAWFSRWAVR